MFLLFFGSLKGVSADGPGRGDWGALAGGLQDSQDAALGEGVASALGLNTDARGICSHRVTSGAPNLQLNFKKKHQLHPSTREAWGDHPTHSWCDSSDGFV